MSVPDFVWWLLRDTGIYAARGAYPDGKARQANLDALYDCLTDIGEDTCVGFFEPEEENEIRPYLQRVKRVLRDAENENLHLAVVFGTPEDNLPEGDEGDGDL